MGYHDRDQESAEAPPASTPLNWLDVTQGVLGILVRLTGIGLMAVGLWVGVEVVIEAWALYRDPGRIQVFADALERGMNINAMMAELTRPTVGEGVSAQPKTPLGIAFMLAWFIAPMLLFTVGYLAMSAVRTGGMLALGNPRLR